MVKSFIMLQNISVTFHQFNASLLSKNIILRFSFLFLILLTQNLSTLVRGALRYPEAPGLQHYSRPPTPENLFFF